MDRAGVARGNRQYDAHILAAGDGKRRAALVVGIIIAVVIDGQRDSRLTAVVLDADIGDALTFFIADKVQVAAGGLGLRPDGLIGAGTVDEVFRRADGVDGGVLVVGRVGAFALGAHDVRLGDAGGQQRGADKPRGGQRGAAFRQQLQRKQRSGAEQQRAQREKAERELEHSHDLADGGAEPALDKIPREGVEREHERQHGKAGGSVQVLCGGACVPAGLGAPQAVKRQRKRQQQRQTGGQRHVVGRALGGGAARRAEEAEQLHGVQAVLLQLTDQITAVDKERDGAGGNKKREKIPRAQPHGQQRGLDPGQQPRGVESLPQAQKTKQNQQQRRQLTGEQMALHHGRHAQRHRQPIPEAGPVAGVDAVQTQQHEREKRHGRELADGGAGVDAGQPIGGQRVEQCPQQTQPTAGRDSGKAEIGDQAGHQRDRKEVDLVAGAQRQPQVVEQRGQQQKQLTVAKRAGVAIAVQRGRGQPHRELPVGQLRSHGGDALHVKFQIMAEVQIVAEQRQTGQQRDARQRQR